jgi:hypothetical protein
MEYNWIHVSLRLKSRIMIEQDEIKLGRDLIILQHDRAFQYKKIAGNYPFERRLFRTTLKLKL